MGVTPSKPARQVAFWDSSDRTAEDYGPVSSMTVAPCSTRDLEEFTRRWHYAGYPGAVLWRYGLWDAECLVGVVSYNLPTMTLCKAVFGEERWTWVGHMGRLVCAENTPRNVESRLIAGSLKLLRQDRPQLRAVLTYAAKDAGHIGTVYKATNALYTGLGGHTLYYIDKDGKRHSTYDGWMVTADDARERGWTVMHGELKHRYLYLLGSKSERREARRLLTLPVLDYP